MNGGANTYISVFESVHAVPDTRRHWWFRANSVAQVDAFHAAGIAFGGEDGGGSGIRDYHAGYYAARICSIRKAKKSNWCSIARMHSFYLYMITLAISPG
jgi:hypothetical protein